MSVATRCQRIYDKESLKAIIQSCGCCPPEDPRCPPLDSPLCGRFPVMKNENCDSNKTLSSCCSSSSIIYSPCTGFSCITCPPTSKSIPITNNLAGSTIRTPMISGGLFYIGTSRIHPKPACFPKFCCHSKI